MARKHLSIIAMITALAACTPAEQAAVMALGPTPVLDGGIYSSGGGITVAAQVNEIDGMTGLCGVWAESKRQAVFTKGLARKVMHTGSAYLDGTILHRDLAFMAKVDPMTSYAGQGANCVKTQRPWSAADAGKPVKLRIPKQVVHREIDDGDGVGIVVTFSQTGPGAMSPSLKSLILDN